MIAINPSSFLVPIIFLSTLVTTMFVQPVASLEFEFTGTEKAMGFELDDDGTDDLFYSVRGGSYSEKECRTISEYYC
jgi:hypothetical protein